jgi:ArsR family transcriptional regulator, virulence genes transcriptional regulator
LRDIVEDIQIEAGPRAGGPRERRAMTRRPQSAGLRGDDLAALIPKTQAAEKFLKAIANSHRLMILCELHKGEHCVSALQQAVGLSQSSLSQHLARLRQDALVKTRRDSRTIYYSLADDRVAQVIALLHQIFCSSEISP